MVTRLDLHLPLSARTRAKLATAAGADAPTIDLGLPPIPDTYRSYGNKDRKFVHPSDSIYPETRALLKRWHMNIVSAVVASNGGMNTARERMFPNQFWDWNSNDHRLYVVPVDLMSKDLMLLNLLEFAILKLSDDPQLQRSYSALKDMQYLAFAQPLTSRRVFILIYRSFRYGDEDQFSLTNKEHLQALRYEAYGDDRIEELYTEWHSRVAQCGTSLWVY